MFTHDLDPVLLDIGIISIRWYSLAYIFGILIGWWYGRVIILKKFYNIEYKLDLKFFDDLITYIIISIILGGRIGYILFYNFEFYFKNPLEIFKIWNGGMSFHGALLGVIVGTLLYAKKNKLKTFLLLDVIACVSPIGIFLGRIANFINGELVGKATSVYWGVIFPKTDNIVRHPSQLYEALIEGIALFFIMNFVINKKNYKVGNCSFMFLIFYGVFRIFSEIFRQPDLQVGYMFGILSMGMLLSIFMIFCGTILYLKRNDL